MMKLMTMSTSSSSPTGTSSSSTASFGFFLAFWFDAASRNREIRSGPARPATTISVRAHAMMAHGPRVPRVSRMRDSYPSRSSQCRQSAAAEAQRKAEAARREPSRPRVIRVPRAPLRNPHRQTPRLREMSLRMAQRLLRTGGAHLALFIRTSTGSKASDMAVQASHCERARHGQCGAHYMDAAASASVPSGLPPASSRRLDAIIPLAKRLMVLALHTSTTVHRNTARHHAYQRTNERA